MFQFYLPFMNGVRRMYARLIGAELQEEDIPGGLIFSASTVGPKEYVGGILYC